MYESFLQLRINEIHRERLAEAAARRLAREAKAASTKDPAGRPGLVARLRRGLGSPAQPADLRASATSRTPSSISETVTVP
jgi:hypothetical protein